MVLTTIADENGNFSYDLADGLTDGEHTVYVAVTDETGKVTSKSRPLSFFVQEAQAVSASDLIQADLVLANAPVEQQLNYFLFGALALVIIGALAAVMIISRVRRDPTVS
jgi:hypothetical protein